MRKATADHLPLPARLLEELSFLGGQRGATVLVEDVEIRAAWFRDAARAAGLPDPNFQLLPDDGSGTRLCRASLFIAARYAARDDLEALRLVLHTLAWGSGPVLRLHRLRIEGLATAWREPGRPRIAALRHALSLASVDPEAAYERCRPGGEAFLNHIGPSTFTKLLYFAGEGLPDHPSLILDRYIAAALRDVGGWTQFGRSGSWATSTYASYLALLRRWSAEASAARERTITPDEIEYELSRAARGKWAGVPAAVWR